MRGKSSHFIFDRPPIKLSRVKTMDGVAAIIVVLLCAGTFTYHIDARSHYTAAVVEYSPLWDRAKSSEENIMSNAIEYEKFIKAAHTKNADIIVFPEMGLFGDRISTFVPVPDPADNIAPRKTEKQHQVLRKLSAVAFENRMYVVVNLLEESTSQNGSPTRYNTNVVFDREGTVIARYRKYNLYDEPYVNSTESPEHSFFDTDFGVRFGVFTCFDILFKEPGLTLWRQYNVTDFVYPTAWFSKLPHLTAIGVQWGWSYATGATLLASGENSVRQSHSGSGIYRGAAPPLAYRLADVDGSFMLLATLPKTGSLSSGKASQYTPAKSPPLSDEGHKVTEASKLRVYSENLTDYETILLPSEDDEFSSFDATHFYWNDIGVSKRGVNYVVNRTLCQGKFCCHFYAEVSVNIGPRDATLLRGDDFQFFRYRLAVRDGVTAFGHSDIAGVQECAVVPCLDGQLDSCGRRTDDGAARADPTTETLFNRIVVSSSDFRSADQLILPAALGASGRPGEFCRLPREGESTWRVDGAEATFTWTAPKGGSPVRLATAGITARLFDRDRRTPP